MSSSVTESTAGSRSDTSNDGQQASQDPEENDDSFDLNHPRYQRRNAVAGISNHSKRSGSIDTAESAAVAHSEEGSTASITSASITDPRSEAERSGP